MPLTEYATGGVILQDEPATIDQAEHFEHLDLALVIASATNPRTHFDPEKLQQLADSIQATGVHQPMLVRRLPAARVADTAHLTPRPTHEIVSGERRYRACKLAGLATIPAMVRALTDTQVLEIQLIENLQRDDLTPLEEAGGYARLVAGTAITKEQIGERIGKSRGYVYARLKLLDLCQEGQKALQSDKIEASVAEKIARVPGHKLQLRALEYAQETDYYDRRRHSFNDVKEWIDKELMRPLGRARFSITAVDLIPSAGSCRECPKRTGAEPELFSDVKGADVCTDTACFAMKEAAHDASIVAKAAERGQRVLTGKEAKEISPYDFNERAGKLEGYKRLDKPDHRTGSSKSLKKLLGKDCPGPVLLQSPHTGELIEVLPDATVNKLLKEKGHINARQAVAGKEVSKDQAARDELAAFEKKWRLAAIEQLHAKMRAAEALVGPPSAIAQCIGTMLLGGLSQNERTHVAKLLGLGKVASREGIEEHLAGADHKEVTSTMLLIMMEHDTRNVMGYHYDQDADHRIAGSGYRPSTTPRIDAVAEAMGLDLKQVQERIRDEADTAQPALKSAPKYRCKDTGSTWSGRGQQPIWVRVALERGKTLQQLEYVVGEENAEGAADEPEPSAADGGADAGIDARAGKPWAAGTQAWPFPSSPTEGLAAQAAHPRKGKSPAAKPAAPPHRAPAGKRKMSVQEASTGIAAAMQDAEASALAAAIPATPTATDDAGLTLLQIATELVLREQKATVRLLKTELSIGTGKAIELMAGLEKAGTVSAVNERGARVVLASQGVAA